MQRRSGYGALVGAFTFLEMLIVIVLMGVVISYSLSGLYTMTRKYAFKSDVNTFKASIYRTVQWSRENFTNMYFIFKDSTVADTDALTWINSDPSVATGHFVGINGNVDTLIVSEDYNGVLTILKKSTYGRLLLLSNVRYFRFSYQGNGRVYSTHLKPLGMSTWLFCDQVNCFSPPGRTEALMFSQRNQPFTIYVLPKDITPRPTTTLPCPNSTKYAEDGCFVVEQTGAHLRLCQGNIGDTTLNNVFAGATRDACF